MLIELFGKDELDEVIYFILLNIYRIQNKPSEWEVAGLKYISVMKKYKAASLELAQSVIAFAIHYCCCKRETEAETLLQEAKSIVQKKKCIGMPAVCTYLLLGMIYNH